MSETVKISTTMRPSDEIEVEEAEFIDLLRQGLIEKVNGKTLTEKQKEATAHGSHGN